MRVHATAIKWVETHISLGMISDRVPPADITPRCAQCGDRMFFLPPLDDDAPEDGAAWGCLDCGSADMAVPPAPPEADEASDPTFAPEIDAALGVGDVDSIPVAGEERNHVCPNCGGFTDLEVSPREAVLFWRCPDCRAEGEEPVTEAEADLLRIPSGRRGRRDG